MVNNLHLLHLLVQLDLWPGQHSPNRRRSFPTYFNIGGRPAPTRWNLPDGNGLVWLPVGPQHGPRPVERRLLNHQGEALPEDRHELSQKPGTPIMLIETGEIGSYFFTNIVDFANGVTNLSDTSSYYQKFSPLQDAHIRMYNLGVYAMDEWAIQPNLKLTLGIRFDRTPNPTCLDKCFSHLTDQFSLPSFQKGVDIPYNASIQTGLSQPYYSVDPVVADPRLAVVWTPGKGEGTGHSLRLWAFFGSRTGLPGFQRLQQCAVSLLTRLSIRGKKWDLVSDPNSAAAAALNPIQCVQDWLLLRPDTQPSCKPRCQGLALRHTSRSLSITGLRSMPSGVLR